MDRFVPLSTIEYFTQGNTMIGSVTPEHLTANPLAKIFQYRVFQEDDALTALYYIDNVCFDLTDQSAVVRASFPLNEGGIDEAAEWLHQAYNAYEQTA